ncbi:thioredoxin domain-containing protein [Methyloraptor flagellatus]|uniref:Thioredoxin domain-containing protein n=1 Tax=Methyloraptor flagellatus TaxID=3162530 RepID=A0AAU7X9I0_9HYPH
MDIPMNLLAGETSPYLLQHADNPVDWRPWGPAALAEAKATGKPILLSIGYAACHWCHVMAHESFEDEAVASVMNRLFVNIKVDREERPDIDQIYMAALHALGEPGGWPLTMFLSPEGEPFWGGTYFPKQAKWGKPGFTQVLEEVARVFREEPDRVAKNRRALIERIETRAREGAPLHRPLLDAAAEKLLAIMDPDEGGTQGAPKFPQAGLLELLWRAGTRTGVPAYKDAALLALRKMAQGGIYDHLGGGFARYSVDDHWLVPHFEKMLYDNGQLLDLYCLAHAETDDPLFRDRIEETIGWLTREMTLPGGAYASSLDADSEGVEGKFYVWDETEIRSVLGIDADLFITAYGVRPEGNWEEVNILNRSGAPDRRSLEDETRLAAARAKLLAARAHRVRPGLDDKVLADWNGLAIAGLARCGAHFERPDWVAAAWDAYRFVTESMTRGDRFGHSWREGRLVFPGMASDFAQMIRAALTLHRAIGDEALIADAVRWADALHTHYWDETAGGVYMTAGDAEALVVRPKSALDEATPNANGTLADSLVRLWILTGEPRFRDRADRILLAFSGDVLRNVFGTASLLNALDTRLGPVEVVIAAPPGTSLTPMRNEIAASTDLRVIPFVVESIDDLPEDHPARGKAPISGMATAFVCRDGACSLPVTEPAELRALLTGRPMPGT